MNIIEFRTNCDIMVIFVTQAMNHSSKGTAKNIFIRLTALILLAIPLIIKAEDKFINNFYIFLTADSLPIPSSGKMNNVSDTLRFKTSKDTLDAPVFYKATDSMVIDIPGKKIMLYGKESNVRYIDNELTAPRIEYSQNKNLVSAHLQKDSSGKVTAFPTFNQSDFKTISDSISFNMKTGKGMTKGTYTQQGEMFVYGEKIKKINNDVFFAKKGRFTTCNLDTPHFAFVSSKIKFINKKMAFTGPVHPEIEGVPLPVMLPFGIYPLTQGRHSGLMAPSFTANNQLGMALDGLGYYKILSENWDVVMRGTIYSYGGWTMNVSPRYFRKYRYQGSFSLDMQRFKNGFKGDPDYSSTQTYNIRWSHNADTKARPGVTFNANVNAGSSKFNALVPNSPERNFANQLNSSIAYSKVWKDKPFNLAISANHNQNTTLRQININLPDISFNVNTQYPFRRKEITGKMKWYENIGIALNSNTRSLSTFYDTLGNVSKQLADNFKWGATHNVPVTLSLPALGPFQISPSMSYQEKWYQEKFIRTWNDATKKLDTAIRNGFYTAREMSFGVGMTTRIFGMFGFGKNSKVQAIRHEIRPNISANYKPNMNKNNFYSVQTDAQGNKSRFNFYERSIFGSFGEGRFGGLSFGLDNIVQMKVKNQKDTGDAPTKKISLIDGLSINGSYNFLADSFRFSPLSVAARTNLFDKINITANAQFDPYQTNAQGRRINELVWKTRPASLGTLTGGGISLQSRFSGGDSKQQANNNNRANRNNQNANGMPMDEYQREAAYMSNNPGEFADFSIPWDLNFAYSLRFARVPDFTNPGTFKNNFNQDINFNGSLNLSPKWKVGMTGSYNITAKQLGVLTLNLSRELHCWQMNIVVSPVGRFKFFTININPKSNILRDIKVNRTRYFFDL